jgi:hypothetical protein
VLQRDRPLVVVDADRLHGTSVDQHRKKLEPALVLGQLDGGLLL